MHLYLNYAREHWVKPGENPPVGLILCAEKGAAEAHYALDNLPNKVLAAEYQTILPDEKLIAEELEKSRREHEVRKRTSTDVRLTNTDKEDRLTRSLAPRRSSVPWSSPKNRF